MFDGSSGEWLARIAEAGRKRMTLARRAQDARAGNDPRRLARLRAGEAPGDRLAGREGDRARRGAADPGDHPADDRRAREAGAPRGDRDRGRRAMRTDDRCRRSPNPRPLAQFLDSRDPSRTLYFADEGGGEPAAEAFGPGARGDPDRARRRLHRGGARKHSCGAQCRRPFRSARESFAPKPPRSPRWPPTWPWPAIGAASALIGAIRWKCWRGPAGAAKPPLA